MATTKKPLIIKKSSPTSRTTSGTKKKTPPKKMTKAQLFKNKVSKRLKKPLNKRFPKINFLLGIALITGIIMVGVFLFFSLYIIIFAPKFDPDLLYNKEATVIYDVNGKEYARLGAENRELVTYDELPQVLVDAIVATEDSRFFQHNGFDIARFMKASLGQLSGNSSAGGASTLTMQVVKNTFTSRNSQGLTGIIRKFTDIYMAVFKIERNYTKEEIIEFYVNAPWLGNGTYGVEQACQNFFGKSVKDLSLAEASLVAGLFKAPNTFNPFYNENLAAQRRSTVLALMVKHGYITKAQKGEAEQISVASLLADVNASAFNKYQGFIDTVVEEVVEKTGNDPYNIPMQIYSTMNPEKQDVLNKLNNGDYYEFVNDVVQVAIAVTDVENGSITAINAGRNQTTERSFNRATMMNRHPGSTAKPFIDYGPLIEFNNASTYTPFLDEKTTYSNGQTIKNADNVYNGLLTMRQALVRSRNIPALRAFKLLDKEEVATFVHSLGIDYGKNLYESAAVGSFEGISPLKMAAAYAAFARGGYYIAPYSFTKLIYTESNEVYEQKPIKTKVMSEETAYMINSMLVTGGSSGVGGNINISGTQVAAKGGTSTYDYAFLKSIGVPANASADNWMQVYSPDYSISVWYGYDKVTTNYYTSAIAGANARKRITAAVANRIFEKNAKFSRPSGVVSVEIELESFPPQLPSAFTPENLRVTELFKKGTQPTDVSKRFSQLDNPTNSTYSSSGNTITITWDPVAKPEAVSQAALQKHFTEYYEEHSQKYFEKRLAYNNTNIGEFGYRVYLKDTLGNLTYLGFTTQSTFTYTGSIVNPNFVVKSSYSIFAANMSPGIVINSASSPGNITNPDETADSLSLNGNSLICIKTGTGIDNNYLDNDSIKVLNSNGDDITTLYSSKIIKKYYDKESNTIVNNIPLNIAGKYTIRYFVDKLNTSRTILICQNGCNANKSCN